LFQWKVPHLYNEKNRKVMDIAGGRDTNNNNIGFWGKHNGLNQQWDLIYADDMPR
jgi:hypothetical protein